MELITLKPEQYPILQGFPDQFVPDPENSVVVVAADHKRLAGRLCLMSLVHIEALLVDPEYRGSDVFKRLMDAAEVEARKLGLKKVFGYAVSKEIEEYLQRLGWKQQKWTVWEKEVA